MLPISINLEDSFFKPEEQWGFQVTEERKKLWAVELDLLMKLDEVCRRERIRYFIDSGTLLGAVRHKGFIPWDDDIDVIMLREDYERFINLPKETFPEPYFVQTECSDDLFIRPHAQIRNSLTTAIVKKEGIDKIKNQGIFIDVFPLDRVSRFSALRAMKYKSMRLYYSFVCQAKYGPQGKSKLKDSVGKLIYFMFHGVSSKRFMRVYHNMAKRCLFPDDKVTKLTFFTLLSLSELEKRRFPLLDFEETVYLPFENSMVPAPKEWNDVLEVYYGKDYMKPVYDGSIHGEMIIDTERPYTQVILELREQLCDSDTGFS